MNPLAVMLFVLIILLIIYLDIGISYEPYSEYMYVKKIHKDTLNKHKNWQLLHNKKYRIYDNYYNFL